jgi:hypothetical protein
VNGFRVDFYWPDLGLVVETDGLTTHRTPAQQAADLVRDQTHAADELVPLRFARGQVRFQPGMWRRSSQRWPGVCGRPVQVDDDHELLLVPQEHDTRLVVLHIVGLR